MSNPEKLNSQKIQTAQETESDNAQIRLRTFNSQKFIKEHPELPDDVIEAHYDSRDPSSTLETTDREYMRFMVKEYSDDPELKTRLYTLPKMSKKREENQLSDQQFNDFLNSTGNFRLLDKNEVIMLMKNIKTGVAAYRNMSQSEDFSDDALVRLAKEGTLAYNIMFQSNLRLAAKKAARTAYHYPHYEPTDALHDAYFGLQNAIEKFDETKGFTFATYATVWIRQSLLRQTDENARIIRIPVHQVTNIKKLNRISSEIEQKTERKPNAAELAEVSGLRIDEVKTLLSLGSTSMTSLNIQISEDSDGELGDMFEDEKAQREIEEVEIKNYFAEIVSKSNLSKEEKLVLSLRYGVVFEDLVNEIFSTESGNTKYQEIFDKTQLQGLSTFKDIGKLMGLSRQYIVLIEQKALTKIEFSQQSYEKEDRFRL